MGPWRSGTGVGIGSGVDAAGTRAGQSRAREIAHRVLLTSTSLTASAVVEANGERSLSFLAYGVAKSGVPWDRESRRKRET
jgi:hypothetical protein